MGGARRYPFPRWVWSPAGGWWGVNPNANRNFGILLSVWGFIIYGVYTYGESKTIVYKRKYGPEVEKLAKEIESGVSSGGHHH